MLWKREDPSSNHRYSNEKLGMVLCDHSVSGQRQEGRWGLLASSLAPGFMRDLILKGIKWRLMEQDVGRPSQACADMHKCAHTSHAKYTHVKKGVAVLFVEENNKEKSLLDAQFSSFILKTLSNWNQSAT